MERLTYIICLATILAFAAFIALACRVSADTEHTVLFWYGSSDDGHLGRPTAFASWWVIPEDIPLVVRDDWPGVALRGYAPGTKVRITVVGVPEWGRGWLDEQLIGNSTLAVVADRPGGPYGDAWQWTFQQLAPLWVGKLYVKIEVAE